MNRDTRVDRRARRIRAPSVGSAARRSVRAAGTGNWYASDFEPNLNGGGSIALHAGIVAAVVVLAPRRRTGRRAADRAGAGADRRSGSDRVAAADQRADPGAEQRPADRAADRIAGRLAVGVFARDAIAIGATRSAASALVASAPTTTAPARNAAAPRAMDFMISLPDRLANAPRPNSAAARSAARHNIGGGGWGRITGRSSPPPLASGADLP